jgi:hypothetical protein
VRGWFLITRGALLLTIAGAAAGCGRLGFDTSDPAGEDGGGGGGSDGGGGGDAAGNPDSGIAPSCGTATSLVVSTDADEDDAGESPSPPHLGTGLSLREAIALSNAQAGHDCIEFDRPMTIMIDAAALPAIGDPDGVDLDGGDQVHVTGIPTGPPLATGIDLASGANAVRGLRVSNFQICLVAGSSDNTIGPDDHVHGCNAGLRLAGSNSSVVALSSHDNTEHGIQVQVGVDGSEIVRAILYRNGIDGVQVSGPDVLVRHATIAGNGTGIQGNGDAAVRVDNSIFYQNGGSGIAVENEAFVDFSDFFQDDCSNCFIGANSITADPMFADAPGDDFSLVTGSPAINAGTDTGLDVNGDQPGSFNGAAPDLGALESDE